MLAAAALLVALTAVADQAPQTQTAVVPATSVSAPSSAGAKIWVGREAEFEEFLKAAPITRIEEVPIGVTKPMRAYFEPGGLVASVVFKPLQPGRSKGGYFESYKSEIAAYELDKLLGLGMVPPTVERRAKHDLGSAQLWVEHCVWLKTKDPNTSGDIARWNRQVYRHRVWDNLTGNIDRNEGNLLVDPQWNLILIDHSRAFTSTTKMPFPMTRIDRPFYEKLKALTEDDLKTHLDGLLFDGPKSVLKRRDLIVKHFEKLIKEKGEAAVLIP